MLTGGPYSDGRGGEPDGKGKGSGPGGTSKYGGVISSSGQIWGVVGSSVDGCGEEADGIPYTAWGTGAAYSASRKCSMCEDETAFITTYTQSITNF